MKPVKPQAAVTAGAIALVLIGLILQFVVNSGSTLPRHSWWEAGILLLAGGALVGSGWNIRRYVRSLSSREDESGASEGSHVEQAHSQGSVEAPSPETARRTLVLAQAAALGGAVLAGWYFAQVAVQLPRWGVTSVRQAVVLLAVLGIEAVGLSVVGFTVQQWCTIPEDKR